MQLFAPNQAFPKAKIGKQAEYRMDLPWTIDRESMDITWRNDRETLDNHWTNTGQTPEKHWTR